jgi:hypothetical protein
VEAFNIIIEGPPGRRDAKVFDEGAGSGGCHKGRFDEREALNMIHQRRRSGSA